MIVEIGPGEGVEQVALQHDQDAQAPEPVEREHPFRACHLIAHLIAMVALRGHGFQREAGSRELGAGG